CDVRENKSLPGLCKAVEAPSCCAFRASGQQPASAPPFPPAAERCALTCVESIICVSVDRPFPASSRTNQDRIVRAEKLMSSDPSSKSGRKANVMKWKEPATARGAMRTASLEFVKTSAAFSDC